jgi:hypothetical protein
MILLSDKMILKRLVELMNGANVPNPTADNRYVDARLWSAGTQISQSVFHSIPEQTTWL